MKKVILALALFTVAAAANAVEVILIKHNQTSGSGTISTLITDGSHPLGNSSNAIWDWNGTVLTSTGRYSATGSISSLTTSASILNDKIFDLSIDTSGAGLAGATSYKCNEGTFLALVGANGCGGYLLGANAADDSIGGTVYSGTTVTQTLNLTPANPTIPADDIATAGPRTLSAYNFGTVTSVSGSPSTTAFGDVFNIGNGIALGGAGTASGGEIMQFEVIGSAVPVPAAVWLFGSALGLLGWVRRRVAK